MRPRDADIPKGLQGDLTVMVADAGGCRVVLRHPLEDGQINDPQFRELLVRHSFRGISHKAADAIARILDACPDDAPPPSRAEILRRALSPTP